MCFITVLNIVLKFVEIYGPFVVMNEIVFIPTHLTTDLISQHVFQPPRNHLQDEDKIHLYD